MWCIFCYESAFGGSMCACRCSSGSGCKGFLFLEIFKRKGEDLGKWKVFETRTRKRRKRTKVGETLGDWSSIWATLFNKLSIFLSKFTSSIFQLTIYKSLRKMDLRIEIFMPKFIVYTERSISLNCRLILAFGKININPTALDVRTARCFKIFPPLTFMHLALQQG